MSVTYAHLWERDTFSDVVIVLKAREACGPPGEASRVLKTIPAHRALLSVSPYFCSQLERWQQISPACKRPRLDCEQQHGASKASAASPDQQQQQPELAELVLTIDSEVQETAAVAVLAALYGVSTATEQLTDEQQLHMAILADKWQVAAVADSAVSKLAARPAGAQGLSDAAQQLLLGLQAWPDCLVSIFPELESCFGLQEAAVLWDTACAPISPAGLEAVVAALYSCHMQQQLLKELGDLEEVWQVGSHKQKVLLGLPLSAIQLLLSSSELQVVSEDTVLFTAQEYVDAQKDPQLKLAAQVQLGQLVRCPELQMSWLATVATTECTESVLHPFKQQVGALHLCLKHLPAGCWDVVKRRMHRRLWRACGSCPSHS